MKKCFNKSLCYSRNKTKNNYLHPCNLYHAGVLNISRFSWRGTNFNPFQALEALTAAEAKFFDRMIFCQYRKPASRKFSTVSDGKSTNSPFLSLNSPTMIHTKAPGFILSRCACAHNHMRALNSV